jgi:S-DNA-T family DNA segregation ATPase FtsK/SpoIIIE
MIGKSPFSITMRLFMARPLAKSSAVSTPWSDIPALLMLSTGTLLYLALISYVPADLPTWVPFSQYATPNSPAQNFIGPVGAIVAGAHYFMIGAASFLVAALLLGFGGAKLFFPSARLRSRVGWMLAFVLCGACLAQLQPWFLRRWGVEFNAYGPGGCLGAWLGERVLQRLLGSAGSAIFLMTAYLCTLIRMTGLHPITQLQRTIDALRRIVRQWRERRLAARLARATVEERLDIDHRRLAKERQRLEKQLRRQGVSLPPGNEDDDAPSAARGPEDEFAHLPPPTITDNSIAPAPLPKKKPLLSEVLARMGGGGKNRVGNPADELGINDGGDIRFVDYHLPDTDLLDTRQAAEHPVVNTKELEATQAKIIETLEQFGIRVSAGDITKGPTITRYEVYPSKGVRVDKIVSLDRDLMRATRAERINILAPIPGKDTVGIEIANNKKVKVTLREILESADFQETKARIPLALGKDVYGKTIIADLADMPHCLIAGTTGSGKSVCINSIIASILYKFKPEELRLIMVDPKVVELQAYNVLPHLAAPVVTDPKKVLLALRWAIDEMDKRYKLFAKTGVRNITGYNNRPRPKSQAELDAEAEAAAPPAAVAPPLAEGMAKLAVDLGEGSGEEDPIFSTPKVPVRNLRDEEANMPEKLPYIVILIDELADLMQTAPADVESAIARLAALARAAGIHMIVATQTPRADVVTGVIKANIPSRIAFQVANPLDSRIILNENGAERLLGQGDMLYLPPRTSRLVRAQGVFVSDEEVHRVVEFAAKQGAPTFEPSICDKLDAAGAGDEEDVTEEDEELVQKCIEIMRQEKKCSTSMLQRRLRLGYTRAARVVDILENRGIVGPENGARGREILVDLDQPLEI